MAEPTFVNLFGTGSTYNSTSNKLEIPKAALEAAGVTDASTAKPIELFAALVTVANSWLSANTDQAVMAASRLSVNAPFQRNGVDKTSYTYQLQFFGAYNAPTFDPDDL
jgi:hypothetical protein